MGNKDKMVQIYEKMADITLAMLERVEEAETILNNEQIQMISATLFLHNAIADERQSELLA